LKELILNDNQLTDISALQSLTQLKTLDLSHNQLTDISALQSLAQLNTLWLSYNQLTDISALQSLTELKTLDLNCNQLTDISALQSLTQLKTLDLSHNQLTDISALKSLTQLNTLNLVNNKIIHLPTFIAQCHMDIKWELSYLGPGISVYGNPLETPPIEIIIQGWRALHNYFAELEKAEVLLLQAKLLFVGSGEVGKTTLMRTLTEPGFQLKKRDIGKEETTHGIRIKPWKITCPLEADTQPSRELTLHTWDFGGQEIYLSTHQFFLTKRSLYIFVWEARKEEESRSFDYWLNVVKLLSDNSPVIVVMNKADVRAKPIDEAAYRDKFKNIAAFLQVSCLDRRGIDELNRNLRQVLGRMPHLKDTLPEAWQEIRQRLETEQKNYIDAARYYEICSAFGLDRDRADFLSDYLHDLGAILRFRTDPLLKNTLILNPEWATEAVYKLIDTPQILENKGRFGFEKLETIWDPVKYPVDKHQQLVRLMEKFELCFNFTGTTTYIVPELVPGQRPGIEDPYFQAEGTLRFQYSYDFMPKGIVSRFIARNYYLIRGERFWQNGVELVFEGSTALIIGDPPRRKLRIWVRGPQKTELLAIIRNDLNHIHDTLNMKKEMNHYDEEVTCNCSSCLDSEEPHLFPFDVLKKMSKKGKGLTCFKSYEDVSPDVLLRGYALPPPKGTLLESLLLAASQLQGKGLTLHPDENSRTGWVAQLLKAQGYIVEEQVLWGQSTTGKRLGELDLKISDIERKTVSIAEAFNLSYLDRNNISNHLKKIFGYDPHGLLENFILVYVDNADFEGLWKKYCAYLMEVKYPFDLLGNVQTGETKMAEINCARTAHSRQGKKTYLYHVFINMPQKK
jgi:small GTP-binding protein